MNWERSLPVGCADRAEQQEAWAEVERLRAMLKLSLDLIRDRFERHRRRGRPLRITYEWDGKNVTMSYFIDGKPYSIFLEEAIAAKAAEEG